MKNPIPTLFSILFLLYSSAVYGVGDGQITVEGYVKSFDQNAIILESGNQGQAFKIPRRFVSNQKFVAGEKIYVQLTSEQAKEIFKQK
jgi:hypothetical protein